MGFFCLYAAKVMHLWSCAATGCSAQWCAFVFCKVTVNAVYSKAFAREKKHLLVKKEKKKVKTRFLCESSLSLVFISLCCVMQLRIVAV